MASTPTYVPIDPLRWRMAMGLRPLVAARWLELDGSRAAELLEKQRLLREAHDRVVATLPGSEGACVELLEEVVAHLELHHPGAVLRRADGTVEECSTRQVVDAAPMHAIDAAGRLVQEDLCVMEPRDGAWRLTAASVCFPSRWSLADKIGLDVSAIHDPVPGYRATLAQPTEAFFDRLRTDRPVWRLNWTLIDRPDLHQPDPADRRKKPDVMADPGRDLWFRVERQTLRRITDRPAVTFTIRTYVSTLADLLAAHPEAAGALRANLTSVPSEVLAYKGWQDLVEPVLSWMDAKPV